MNSVKNGDSTVIIGSSVLHIAVLPLILKYTN